MKRAGKRKPSDIPNQQKITSFFKKSDSCNSNDDDQRFPRRNLSSSLTTQGTKKRKMEKAKAKKLTNKEIEVIVISESSSDSDITTVNKVESSSEIETNKQGSERSSDLCIETDKKVPITLNSKESLSSAKFKSDAIRIERKSEDNYDSESDNNFKPAIKIVDFKQISEVETQAVTDIYDEESTSVPGSPSLLNDNLDITLISSPGINEFLSFPLQQRPKSPESIFDKMNLDFSSNANSDSRSSTTPNFGSTTPKVGSDEMQFPKTPDTERKSIGLFLSPQKKSSSPRTPTKSPKSVATYFSPVRHLRRPEWASPQRPRPMANNNSPNRSAFTTSDPYYYKNFITVINSVFSDKHHEHLVNDNDRAITENFLNLSKQSQCLYIRLFQRKWNFKPSVSIKYPLISENLTPYFQELYEAKFLEEIKDETRDLDVILDLLNGEQMVVLSRSMGVTGKTKEICKAGLLKMSQKQKTLFSSSSEVIYKAAIKLLGCTYRISLESKNLFSRYFILHSPPQYWENVSDQSSNQLLSILLMDMGKMEYPVYEINKKTKIYSSRDELVSFQEAWKLFSELNAHIESKNWEDVCTIGKSCLELLEKQLLDNQVSVFNASLPTFLRVYTAGSVLTHAVWISIEGYQKLKKFSRANEMINTLLAQSVYLVHHRGRWYERSIVNMKHLKTPLIEVIDVIKTGLLDKFTQDSHKYMLTLRYEKSVEEYNKKLSKGSKKDKMEMEGEKISFENDSLPLRRLHQNIPSRTIEGEKLEMYNGSSLGPSGFKSVFLGTKSASSVEQYAMNYYVSEGYIFGVHGEGSVPTSIFGLLFWDEIYQDLPDVFQSVFQPFPLDLNFEEFYNQRKETINKKLADMRYIWSIDDALACIERHFNPNLNKISIVNWSLFSSLDNVFSLVRSLGLQVTASICERMAKNYRHYRSGFPDLCMWDGGKCIFVEVKGPGDSLSPKQSLWIDFLQTAGAQVEVCNVKSVSNKRIRTQQLTSMS